MIEIVVLKMILDSRNMLSQVESMLSK